MTLKFARQSLVLRARWAQKAIAERTTLAKMAHATRVLEAGYADCNDWYDGKARYQRMAAACRSFGICKERSL
jgi:hypothetical protein